MDPGDRDGPDAAGVVGWLLTVSGAYL